MIDLDALVSPADFTKVKLCGREVPVAPLSGFQVMKLAQMGSLPEVEQLSFAYGVARKCLPELTDAEVETLTPAQIGAVIAIAREQLEAVETEVQGK